MEKADFKRIINLIAKNFANQQVTYSQSQYIFKEVRKKLELKPEKRGKGTVKRMSRIKSLLDTEIIVINQKKNFDEDLSPPKLYSNSAIMQ